MDRSTRFKMYKDISFIEPNVWTNNHHIIRITLNSLAINIIIYNIFKLNKYQSYKTLTFYKARNNYKNSFMLVGSVITITFIEYLNYVCLDNYIYNNYYSNNIISDDEFKNFCSSIKYKNNVEKYIDKKQYNK